MVTDQGRRRAAGIYGTIVTAAVLAAGGNTLTSLASGGDGLGHASGVLAGRAVRRAAGRAHSRRPPPEPWPGSSSLAATWPMVTASFVPLASLVVARLLGASASGAADVALYVAIGFLVIHGYTGAKAAGLSGGRLVLVSGTAGLLGLAMVILKAALQHQHQ